MKDELEIRKHVYENIDDEKPYTQSQMRNIGKRKQIRVAACCKMQINRVCTNV